MDPNADLYGRHAAQTAGFSGTIPWRIHGKNTAIPLSSLVRAFDTTDAGKHVATLDHPPGVYFERKGLVRHIEHPYRPHLPGNRVKPYATAQEYLRYGEKSADEYRRMRAYRAEWKKR